MAEKSLWSCCPILHGLERSARRGRLARGLGLGALAALVLAGASWVTLALWPGPPGALDGGPADGDPTRGAGLAAVGPLGPAQPLPDAGPLAAGAPDTGEAADAGPGADADDTPAQAADPGPRRPGKDGPWYALRPGDPRPKPPEPAPPAVEHPVSITVTPPFERLLVDGREVALQDVSNGYGQRFATRLPVGRYRVTIQNTNCQEEEFELEVPEKLRAPDELDLRRKLRFRPATLAVESELPDAAVWVEGVFKGSAAESQADAITIPLEGERGSRALRLELRHPTAGVMVSEVTVRAGQRQLVRAPRTAFAQPADGGGGPP